MKTDFDAPRARQERLAEVRRTRAGDLGQAVVSENDNEQALREYVARRERMGAELVVMVRSPPRRLG